MASSTISHRIIPSCKGADFTERRGRKNHLQACNASASLGKSREEIQDQLLVACVQQPVCLVQNEVLDSAEAELATLHQVLDPSCTAWSPCLAYCMKVTFQTCRKM